MDVLLGTLFTIARTWKQAKCPLTEKWIKEIWYTYRVDYYSAIKKGEVVQVAEMWMDMLLSFYMSILFIFTLIFVIFQIWFWCTLFDSLLNWLKASWFHLRRIMRERVGIQTGGYLFSGITIISTGHLKLNICAFRPLFWLLSRNNRQFI